MNNSQATKVNTTDKVIISIIVACFLFLSLLNIHNGFMLRLDETAMSSYSNYFYLLSLTFFVLYAFIHKSSKSNIFIWLFGCYFLLAYLLSTVLSFKSVFAGVCLYFWMFCYAFGKRLTANVNNVIFFSRAITLIVIIPLSIYSLYLFFTTDLFVNQGGMDAFFFIMVYLPFVLMMDNKRSIKLIMYLVFLVLAFISLKRSIIIAFMASSIVYLLLISHKKLYLKWYFWVLLVSLYFFINYFLGFISETLLYRFSNMSEDGGSGRDIMYKRILEAFVNSDAGNIFFGHGFQSVRSLDSDNRLAHNDFLELLYDFGIFGCFVYIAFLLSLIKTMINTHRRKSAKKTVFVSFVSSFVFFIILGSFNCCIYSIMIISPIMLSLGICKGLSNKPMTYMQYLQL